MSDVVHFHKYVATLPNTLEANAIYYVRVGDGFDIYVTNSSGTIVAKKLNPIIDEWQYAFDVAGLSELYDLVK